MRKVQVSYRNPKDTSGYTYTTDINDLQIGDIVTVPAPFVSDNSNPYIAYVVALDSDYQGPCDCIIQKTGHFEQEEPILIDVPLNPPTIFTSYRKHHLVVAKTKSQLDWNTKHFFCGKSAKTGSSTVGTWLFEQEPEKNWCKVCLAKMKELGHL
jgi:hypothetical protein